MKPLSPVNKLHKNNMLPCLPMSYYPSIIIIPSFSLRTLNKQTHTLTYRRCQKLPPAQIALTQSPLLLITLLSEGRINMTDISLY